MVIVAALIQTCTQTRSCTDRPGEDPVGEAVSLELGGQARLPQLLEQADEVV